MGPRDTPNAASDDEEVDPAIAIHIGRRDSPRVQLQVGEGIICTGKGAGTIVQVKPCPKRRRIAELRAATADEEVLIPIAIGVQEGAGTIFERLVFLESALGRARQPDPLARNSAAA